GTLLLTIPEQLCKPSAYDKYNGDYGVYIVTVKSKVTCEVLEPGAGVSQYHYSYKFIPALPAVSPRSNSNIEVMDIVGSCDGCDRHKDYLPPGPKPAPGPNPLAPPPHDIQAQVQCYQG